MKIKSINHYHRAGFIRRFIARGFIDYFLVFMFAIIIGAITGVNIFVYDGYIYIAYVFFALLLFKKTLGDKLLGIEIISTNSNIKIRWYQILLRMVLAPIALFHALFFLFSNNVQLIHDKIANTDMVLSKKKQ